MQTDDKTLIKTALISFFMGLVVAFASILVAMAITRPCHKIEKKLPPRMLEMQVQESLPFNHQPRMKNPDQFPTEANRPCPMKMEKPHEAMPPMMRQNPVKHMPKEEIVSSMEKKIPPKDKMKK